MMVVKREENGISVEQEKSRGVRQGGVEITQSSLGSTLPTTSGRTYLCTYQNS